jgi:adenylylsulfate kinase
VVTWIIGLAGAGKSTLGRRVAAALRSSGRPVVLLDGDAVRDAFGNDLGHTPEDRVRNGRRIAGLCRLLDGQGIDVVACVLAIDPDRLARNREELGQYVEVFLDVPWATLEARDQKGLYSGARAGRIRDVVGIDIPFPRPVAPDLVLGPAELAQPIDRQVTRIVALSLGRGAAPVAGAR